MTPSIFASITLIAVTLCWIAYLAGKHRGSLGIAALIAERAEYVAENDGLNIEVKSLRQQIERRLEMEDRDVPVR